MAHPVDETTVNPKNLVTHYHVYHGPVEGHFPLPNPSNSGNTDPPADASRPPADDNFEKASWERAQKTPNAPLMYACLYSQLRERAAELGYALMLHGSLKRDGDMLASPWTDAAVAPEALVRELCACSGLVMHNPRASGPKQKPHGRLAWSLFLQEGGTEGLLYVDLSVTPRIIPTTVSSTLPADGEVVTFTAQASAVAAPRCTDPVAVTKVSPGLTFKEWMKTLTPADTHIRGLLKEREQLMHMAWEAALANATPGLTPYSTLEHIRTEEELEAYVQARIQHALEDRATGKNGTAERNGYF